MEISPYVMFGGQCREAFTAYKAILGGDLQLMTYGDAPPGQGPPQPPDHGSTSRRHRGRTPRASFSMGISGGSADLCSMGARSIGLPRSVEADSRSASSRSSISLSW